MITVDYFGRSGNQLFQYVFARMLASQHCLKLKTPAPETFLKIADWDNDWAEGEDIVNVGDNNCYDILYNDKTFMPHYHLHGYFQDVRIYNDRKDFIKKIFDLPPIKKNAKDIVIHLRLADYWWKSVQSVISPTWYLSLLRREKWDKVYIVVEPHELNGEYLQHFIQIPKDKKVIVSGSVEEDFHFIRSFDRIICSNSTFCWWAAFLSEAGKIYTFKPWIKLHRDMNLAAMDGATVVDGYFFRKRHLEKMDWREYWKK